MSDSEHSVSMEHTDLLFLPELEIVFHAYLVTSELDTLRMYPYMTNTHAHSYKKCVASISGRRACSHYIISISFCGSCYDA